MPEALDHLKHIVVLMMENRSFDHMLGSLKSQMPDLDGLTGNETCLDVNGKPQPIKMNAAYQAQLNPDPGHHWEDVNTQIFGNPEGTDDGSPKMQGFIKSYFKKRQDLNHACNILTAFRKEDLPVLTTLAQQFAVCDRWFPSLPGPTVPNRIFAHCGTSFTKVDNALKITDSSGQNIYSRMLSAGRSAKLYYFDEQSASVGFTFMLQDQPQSFGTYDDFKADCESGALPDYCFVEPNYSDHGGVLASDQHPDHNVIAGERFIADVYNRIRANQALWESTLLLIVYDEHGGIYDHVEPPHIPPDGVTDSGTGFAFDRLGVRVPAIFVSPWIQPGTIVHTQYEHASIPATVAAFFIADTAKRKLTVREQRAKVFTDDSGILNLSTPRTDSFFFQLGGASHAPAAPRAMRPASAADNPNVMHIPVPDAPKDAYNPARDISGLLSDHILELHRLELLLPKERQTGIDIRSVNTEAEAAVYIQKVMKALKSNTARKAKAQQ